MCGIAGHIGQRPPELGHIRAALEALQHRGPDSQNFKQYDFGQGRATLLHARLSIIDLEERSNQPFEDEHISLVFNGEIYNYVELRQILIGLGWTFRTQGDTEVLTKCWLQWGVECLDKLEGMWAFMLHDRKKQEVVLCRDRFGEKPLYRLSRNGEHYFASETPVLRRLANIPANVNRDHVLSYLVNGYKSLYKRQETYFADVFEVPAATCLIFDAEGRERSLRYWQMEVKERPVTFEQAVEESREALFKAVKLRMRSDVPIAFCLSGGVDSAALASIAAKTCGVDIHTFSIIDPDPRYNELDNIQATVDDLGCKHDFIELSPRQDFDELRALVRAHDAPVAVPSYFIHSFLSKAMHAAGYRVSVSGTSADEIFTGYYDHHNLYLYEMRNHPKYASRLADWQAHLAPIVRNPHLMQPDLYMKDVDFRGHIYLNRDVFADTLKIPFTEDFKEQQYCEGLLKNRMLNELFEEATPVILHEDDLNSMTWSIENRSPYLDRNLVETGYSFPVEHYIQDGYAKYILRTCLEGTLNDTVRLDRKKKGFNAALKSLIDLDNKQVRDYLLNDSPIFDWVQRDKIESCLSMQDIPNSFSKFLFGFTCAKIFLEEAK